MSGGLEMARLEESKVGSGAGVVEGIDRSPGREPVTENGNPLDTTLTGKEGGARLAVATDVTEESVVVEKRRGWALPELDSLRTRTQSELTDEQLEEARARSLAIDLSDRRALLEHGSSEMREAREFADDYYGQIKAQDLGQLGEIQTRRRQALMNVGEKLKEIAAAAKKDDERERREKGELPEESFMTRLARKIGELKRTAPEMVASLQRAIDEFKVTEAEMGEILQQTGVALDTEKAKMMEGYNRLEHSMEWGIEQLGELAMRIVEVELALERESSAFVDWIDEHQDKPKGLRLQLEYQEKLANLIATNERLRMLKGLHSTAFAGVLDMSKQLSHNSLLQTEIDNEKEVQHVISRIHMAKVVASLENRRGFEIVQSGQKMTGEQLHAMARDMESMDRDIREVLERGAIPVDGVVAFIEAHLASAESNFQSQMAALEKQRRDAETFKDEMHKIAEQSERQAAQVRADLEAEAERKAKGDPLPPPKTTVPRAENKPEHHHTTT